MELTMPNLPPSSSSLRSFFAPNGVAVIGASRDPTKISYGVMRNLTDPERGYRGPIYPINPKADEILGLRCYHEIAAAPDPVELAVLIIPAATVPSAVEACGRRGIKAVVVISGGFREVGPEGAAIEQEMIEIGRRYGMRIMGPNGIGVIDAYTPINTTFVPGMPPAGHIAFLSQSGALCGSIVDWTIGNRIGFSRLLSVGNEADINETDLLPVLAADLNSRVIILYLEDIKGGEAFVPALRDAAAVKPVLVLKTGRTASGQAATASHTGALAGAHAAFRAACRQTGAIEVDRVQTLFNAALALAYQPLPAGNRIAILTNAGGPAAVAADVFEAAGLRLPQTSPETRAVLRGFLHPDAQVAGPVDMLGGADETHYRRALAAVLADPAVDGVLAILTPQSLSRPLAIVEAIQAAVQAQARPAKPVLACLMGKASVETAHAAAHAVELPPYTFPEDAVEAFGILWRRGRWVGRMSEWANRRMGESADRKMAALQRAKARHEVQNAILIARAAGKRALDAVEARPLLAAYGLATPAEALATSPYDAASFAARIGFPVAMKLISPDILHKTEAGGVILNVESEAAASAAFSTLVARAHDSHPGARIRGVQIQQMIAGGQEVIVGIQSDPIFGPLVMFGLGGIYVEVLADVSFRLAPLTAADAEEMIDEVRSAKLLAGVRGAPAADRAALVDAIVRVGQLAADHPEIAELDVNPLLVLPEGQGAIAVDARIILS
jgi:acetate---CoA ligase (ADP-forming)